MRHISFVDVAAEAGIDYLQNQLPRPPDVFVMTTIMSGGAAAGDFDGDGWVDLYVTVLDGADQLYRNNGDGTFTDVAAARGIVREDQTNGAGWADIDNDGDLDLYVTSLAATRYHLYINDGTGHFTEEAVSRGAAIQGPDEHHGYSVTFGDFDSDGYLDIYAAEWRMAGMNPGNAPSNSRLLHNLGSANPGHFEDVTVAAGVAIDDVVGTQSGTFSFTPRFADMDNDGYVDLLLASDFGTSRLFWNNGDGTFTDGTEAAGVGTDENGMGSAVGDVNGDGLLDWFVTAIYDPDDTCGTVDECSWGPSGNRLFLNNGDRTFTDVTDPAGVRDGGWGWGASFFDFDNDADLDLIMTNGFDEPFDALFQWDDPYEHDVMRLWENDGTGVFTEIGAAAGITDTGSGKGLLTFDYDNDGDLDVFIANNGGAPVLYRNDGGSDNDWLRIQAFGSLRGIGAKITVTPELGGGSQYAELSGGNNFLGQDETVAHFGLGEGLETVALVEIVWPDGTVDSLTDVPVNAEVTFGRDHTAPFSGLDGIDYVVGTAGDDTLFGAGGDDHLFGRVGVDVLFGGLGNDSLSGGEDDDVLLGEAGADTLIGGGGNDQAYGADGDDSLLGGDGADVLAGGEGNDAAYGESGNDVLVGGPGNNSLFGGDDDDVLVGDADGDVLDGGDGNDFMVGGDGDDTLGGGSGLDSLMGGDGQDVLDGGSGDDVVEGGAEDDFMLGGDGGDILAGGTGADQLFAGADDDFVDGGSGNDFLDGGAGRDLLLGGSGDDLFVLRPGDGGSAILDFEGAAAPGGDFIVFSGFGAGASLSYTGGDSLWRIDHSADGPPTSEGILILGVVELHESDFVFA